MSVVARLFGGGGPRGPSAEELEAQRQAQEAAQRQRDEAADTQRREREQEARNEAQAERDRIRRRLRGHAGTILTSPLGVVGGPAPLRATLGGASAIARRL